jgi:hypothetical protein
MEKKSFKFYTSWNDAIKKMDEQQVRTFINNLCNYAEGKEVQLNGLMEEIMWSQVQPLLDYNEQMRQKKIENGRKGGIAKSEKKSEGNQELPNLPNPTKSYQTYQDLPMKEEDDVDDDVEEEDDVDDDVEVEVEDDVDSRKMIVDKLMKIFKNDIDDNIITSEEVEGLTISVIRPVVNEVIPNYPEWEQHLIKYGPEYVCNKISKRYAVDNLTYSFIKAVYAL